MKRYLSVFSGFVFAGTLALHAQEPAPPEGFTALFNGKDLSGWWGLGTENYNNYMKLSPEDLAKRQEKSREDIRQHWKVVDGVLVNDGRGLYLSTDKFYGDFELLLEYKAWPKGDSGVYLRGCPQVQIWDSTNQAEWKNGSDKGSGGLWNNSPGAPGKDPLVLADKPFGEWNQMRIQMIGDYVTVYLNEKRVVDNAKLENYFDRKRPVPRTGPIQLQTHGAEIHWRNVYLREIGAEEANAYLRKLHEAAGGFESVFNGKDWTGWKGPTDKNGIENGAILARHGTLFTEKEYADFSVAFEFLLPPGGNNGLAIRYPGEGDTAYTGLCELQVLDSDSPKYKDIHPTQHHGSVYGRLAALRGYLRPAGEWNFQAVTLQGQNISVELNGFVILKGDLTKLDPSTFMIPVEKLKGIHRTSGHFGFAGHGDAVHFRNIHIKTL